jgi:rSAM/selenodomain-associated transferase 2
MVSVIIPTLNEARELPGTLAALRGHRPLEVLVIDAGSNDGTTTIAAEAGAQVLVSPRRQRAAQMNLGAERSSGDMLLFLHADTVLPPGGLERIEGALSDQRVVGGAFARRFRTNSLFLRITCLGAEVRNRLIGWHLGDQAMFVRAVVFRELGGFRPWDQFEDLDFSRRLRTRGRVVTLRPPVMTSARRFDHQGAFLTTIRDFLRTVRYWNDRARSPGAMLGAGKMESDLSIAP